MRECHNDWPARLALACALLVPVLGTYWVYASAGGRNVWAVFAILVLPPLVSLVLGYLCPAF